MRGRPLYIDWRFEDTVEALHGQVGRGCAPFGDKVEQVMQIVFRWSYLLLAVDLEQVVIAPVAASAA
jgi:hypothetical protein